jgi:hypothetical protein
MNAKHSLCLLAVGLFGCDGQQYVSPDTVGLVITNDDTGVTRVDRCNYIPVLLGSRIKWRYAIEGDLKATITITREEIEVTFEGDGGEAAPFSVRPKDFDDDVSSFTAGSPPDGYTVRLLTGCTPDDD